MGASMFDNANSKSLVSNNVNGLNMAGAAIRGQRRPSGVPMIDMQKVQDQHLALMQSLQSHCSIITPVGDTKTNAGGFQSVNQ